MWHYIIHSRGTFLWELEITLERCLSVISFGIIFCSHTYARIHLETGHLKSLSIQIWGIWRGKNMVIVVISNLFWRDWCWDCSKKKKKSLPREILRIIDAHTYTRFRLISRKFAKFFPSKIYFGENPNKFQWIFSPWALRKRALLCLSTT
jgi:hypothetical protein